MGLSQAFEVGARVMVRYRKSLIEYPGVIEGCHAEGYDIVYTDGDRERNVHMALVRDMDELEVGEKVFARYKGRRQAYPGVIKDCAGTGKWDVLYDDGITERGVRSLMIRKVHTKEHKQVLEEFAAKKEAAARNEAAAAAAAAAAASKPVPTPKPPAAGPKLQIGMRVLARFLGGRREFLGTLSGSEGGLWNIEYDDGDSETDVNPTLIRPAPVQVSHLPAAASAAASAAAPAAASVVRTGMEEKIKAGAEAALERALAKQAARQAEEARAAERGARAAERKAAEAEKKAVEAERAAERIAEEARVAKSQAKALNGLAPSVGWLHAQAEKAASSGGSAAGSSAANSLAVGSSAKANTTTAAAGAAVAGEVSAAASDGEARGHQRPRVAPSRLIIEEPVEKPAPSSKPEKPPANKRPQTAAMRGTSSSRPRAGEHGPPGGRRIHRRGWRYTAAAASPSAVGEDAASLWVQCDRCSKWRWLEDCVVASLPEYWTCALNPDAERATCEAEEEAYWEEEGQGGGGGEEVSRGESSREGEHARGSMRRVDAPDARIDLDPPQEVVGGRGGGWMGRTQGGVEGGGAVAGAAAAAAARRGGGSHSTPFSMNSRRLVPMHVLDGSVHVLDGTPTVYLASPKLQHNIQVPIGKLRQASLPLAHVPSLQRPVAASAAAASAAAASAERAHTQLEGGGCRLVQWGRCKRGRSCTGCRHFFKHEPSHPTPHPHSSSHTLTRTHTPFPPPSALRPPPSHPPSTSPPTLTPHPHPQPSPLRPTPSTFPLTPHPSSSPPPLTPHPHRIPHPHH